VEGLSISDFPHPPPGGERRINFNSDIRDEPQETQTGRGSQGVGIVKMVENYDILYFFLD
jgi:hypothetical protein